MFRRLRTDLFPALRVAAPVLLRGLLFLAAVFLAAFVLGYVAESVHVIRDLSRRLAVVTALVAQQAPAGVDRAVTVDDDSSLECRPPEPATAFALMCRL